jgi:predicted HicB family RNase H-like nuclease
MMTYKGYAGKVEFDDEAGIFYGEVINLRDVITFQGTTVRELRQAFRDSVDDYLEFCAQRGEEAEKPFSGKFMVRVSPDVHRELFAKARMVDKSLNSLVSEVLQAAVEKDPLATRTYETARTRPLAIRDAEAGTASYQLTVEEDITRFDLPTALHERLRALLDSQDSGHELSDSERREAEGLVELAEFLSLLRLRAKRVAQNAYRT